MVCGLKRYPMRKSRKDVQGERSCGIRGREKRILVPIELLKLFLVVVLISSIEHIRN